MRLSQFNFLRFTHIGCSMKIITVSAVDGEGVEPSQYIDSGLRPLHFASIVPVPFATFIPLVAIGWNAP